MCFILIRYTFPDSYSVFKKLRIRLPDSPDACGRKPNPPAKKKLRIQKYPDTCGQGVIKLKLCCKRENLHLDLIPVHKQLWEIWKLGKPLSFIPDFRDRHPQVKRILRAFNSPLNSRRSANSIFFIKERAYDHCYWIRHKSGATSESR